MRTTWIAQLRCASTSYVKPQRAQSLEAGLFEIVEMDRMIDMTEGIQLVSAGLDNDFGDAQFLFAFRSRETRYAIPLGSPGQ